MKCKTCGVALPNHLRPFYFCGEACCDKWWADAAVVKRFYGGVEGDFLDGSCGDYAEALAFVSDGRAVTFLSKGNLHCAVETPHGFLDVAGLLTSSRLAKEYGGLSFDHERDRPSSGMVENDTLEMAEHQWFGRITKKSKKHSWITLDATRKRRLEAGHKND
jgi:hypothetical protein